MIRRPPDPAAADKPPVMYITCLDGGTMNVETHGRPESVVFWLNTLLCALNALASDREDYSGLVKDVLDGIGKEKAK